VYVNWPYFLVVTLLITPGKKQLMSLFFVKLFCVPEINNGIRLFALAEWKMKLAMDFVP
jgi:hypothetical protein